MRHILILGALVGLLGQGACTGQIGEPGQTEPTGGTSGQGAAGGGNAAGAGGGGEVKVPDVAPKEDGVAPALTRRLSNRELGNAFEAVLGYRPATISQLPSDKKDYLFDRVVQGQTVTLQHVEAYATIASDVAAWLTAARLGGLVPSCGTAALPADGPALLVSRRTCVEAFVDQIGPRAFRRPLDPARRASLLALYDGGGTYADGFSLLVRSMFTSPEFLYVVELGTAVAGKPGVFALTDYEVATRLSLFLCETVPDAGLLTAAKASKLNTADQIGVEAERVFNQACAQRTLVRFFTQWLKAEVVNTLARDTALYPKFTPAAKAGMIREQEEFARQMTFELGAKLPDLFTADFTFLDKDSAPLYGLTSTSATPQKVMLPPERRGLLTQPGVLAVTTRAPILTTPTLRGVFVLRDLLCQELTPPPADIPRNPDDGTRSSQDQAREHAENPECSGCHKAIDPPGMALEDFDAIGQYRTEERGKPVNPVGGVPTLGIPDGTIRGGAQLSAAIAPLKELRECFAKRWLRFGLGRLEGTADAKSLWELKDMAGQPDKRLRDVMLGLTRTYAFRHRAVAP